MKMKYYLRGLATGLVIAAVLMSFTADGKRDVSDEEIKERAAKLGMVMPEGGTTLADGRKPQQTGTGESREPGGSGETPETGETGETSGTQETGESGEPQGGAENQNPESGSGSSDVSGTGESKEPEESGATPEPGENGETSGTQGTGENGEPQGGGEDQSPESGSGSGGAAVTVVIYSGYGSNDVARALKNAGLVENAEDFDEFLCENGYDKRICVDVYRIPSGSSYEEIARIITKRG